ncbi:PAS domain S-box protein [Bradyrhizobium sp.]|jgi:PAS domain S-box-containing protein|uniref:PAS domain S-box protein n=1 Tax=Bradyrhizobium sp. TaxID=376 RepID=UPI002DFE6E67|nr:PAS domain S-box protein [Bradyrhizobium sp.]
MNDAEFQLRGGADPRLAVHAASSLPAWLWSTDGTRILWANPVGARVFGAADAAALAAKTFGPADPHRRQVAQLVGRLLPTGATRLERLRGFGATFGTLATCACSRLDFADGGAGVLVVAMLSPGQLQRIDAARPPVRRLERPVEQLESSGSIATEKPTDAVEATGHLVVEPLPESADHAEIEPTHQPDAAAMDQLTPDYEQAAATGEAPAEFALIDEIADCAAEPAVERGVADATTPHAEIHDREPPPFVEAIADEPSPSSDSELPPALELPPAANTPTADELPPPLQTIEPRPAADAARAPPPHPRRHPLRFMWQMDAEGRFALGSDEFTRLIGARTAASLGRLWSEIADVFGLDPEGRVAKAVATRDTWSGIALNWPVDGGARLRVELSGLPLFDRARNFVGYRGFGVCRDLDGLARLEALRRYEFFGDPPAPLPLSADVAQPGPAEDITAANIPAEPDVPSSVSELPASIVSETSHPTDLETAVETPTPKNVLPFRPVSEPKSPSLTPVENSAFNELARQLAARLENETNAASERPQSDAPEPVAEPPAGRASGPAGERPDWLSQPEPPPRGEAARDRTLLDLLPTGVLIYRLDRLLYANPAFLNRVGYDSLHALEEAGGLDALLVEPGVSGASSTSDTGTPVTISATQSSPGHAPASATDAHLHAISWDGDSAHALICLAPRVEAEAVAAFAAPEPSQVGHANAEELGAILDTTAEGIVMFDAQGRLNSCNRSAEALFGYDGDDLVQRNLAELFAPESQRVVQDYLERIRDDGVASLLDHGREVLGRVREGGLIALSMTMGRTQADSPNFFAVFRDLSSAKNSEAELLQARRLADRSASAKADVLARISHEVRTPLNAIIGFAEVMIDERFGALGNERYVEYMKDIRASGERVIAIINDLLDLSRIETGKLDLSFANQNLNDLVEQCVAVMQPQANRERIIIRTSLAHTLPPVVADARALRQIALNLIGNSIHLANAGGQVIVSTALSDFGDVVLRVRDTGHGMNDNEVAAAMEPFRTQGPADHTNGSGVSLALTKALVEANRAQFQIKTGPQSGTLIEVTFGQAMARA